MTAALYLKQPALGAEPAAAVSLEWRQRGDPAALWRALQALQLPEVVMGIGATLAAAVGAHLPELRSLARLQRGRYTMPATPYDVWALVPGADAGQVFERAEPLLAALAPHAALEQATPLFRYRHGHDLTGYKDGTENPTGDAAWAAALVSDGDGAGGSQVLVQRWLHFRDRYAGLAPDARDRVIGRRLLDDEEIAEAPESAHVKRTAQEDFEPPALTASVLAQAPLPAAAAARVRVCSDGPLEVEGALVVAGEPTTHAQLCRCGHSASKPWCDGSHARQHFSAAGELPPIDEPQALVTPGRLRVQPIADGPLVLWGAVELCSDSGRVITRCIGPTLCRCGHSVNKPFCDGAHAAAGFAAGE